MGPAQWEWVGHLYSGACIGGQAPCTVGPAQLGSGLVICTMVPVQEDRLSVQWALHSGVVGWTLYSGACTGGHNYCTVGPTQWGSGWDICTVVPVHEDRLSVQWALHSGVVGGTSV